MNTIKSFTVVMIISFCLLPYENQAGLPDRCTKSNVDIQYKTELRDMCLFLKNCSDDSFVSPLNDIPLYTGERGVFRAVIVIPKLKMSEVMEIDMRRDMNPIRGFRNGEEIFLKWDYGALTQTWEDPCVIDPITNEMGDNGQLDVIVLSEHSYDNGAVVNVKIVGAYPMIVLGTGTNWQIIAIDIKDRRADLVSNIKDFNKIFPGMLVEIEDWVLRINFSGAKSTNKILEAVDTEMAVQVVTDKHNQWKKWQETLRYAPYVNPYNTTLNNKWTIAPWMNLNL